MTQKKSNYVVVIIGLLLLGTGLYFVKTIDDPRGIMQALPYVCIGVGCGLFGQGMGGILSQKAIQNHPEIQKQMDIEKNDERNIAIENRAKGKAFDIMTFVFGALLIWSPHYFWFLHISLFMDTQSTISASITKKCSIISEYEQMCKNATAIL